MAGAGAGMSGGGGYGGIIGAAIGGTVATIGGVFNAVASRKAAKKHKKLVGAWEAATGAEMGKLDEIMQGYISEMKNLAVSFDPYDMHDAYASFYEGVVEPMRHQFDEDTLPRMQAAYAGGIMGQGAELSGAAAEAEGSARRDLSLQEATLRSQERDKAIGRNYQEYGRKRESLIDVLKGEQTMPLMRIQHENQRLGIREELIASQLAADQSWGQIMYDNVNGSLAGWQIGSGMDMGQRSSGAGTKSIGAGPGAVKPPKK